MASSARATTSATARERSGFDVLVWTLTAWTLSCNAVVFAGGSLRTLAWVSVVVVGGCWVLLWREQLKHSRAPRAPASDATTPSETVSHHAVERIFGLVIACAAVGLARWHEDTLLLWLIGLPLSGWCLWREAGRVLRWSPASSIPAPPQHAHRSSLALWAIGLACVVLTSVAHRADEDDAFYVNMAVGAADHPDAALLAQDTLHGIEGVPIALSAYRVQSFELLAAVLSWLTPLRALDCFHVLFPACIALLIPFALAALFRLLTPRWWIYGVLFAVLFLWGEGTPHRSFGNFSFMRLQQGKSVLISLMLPLVAYYGLRYARRPRLRTGSLLAAVQIVAVGTNVTGLWLAPTIAMLAVAAGSPLTVRGARVLGGALVACAYPLGVGLLLKRATEGNLRDAGLLMESEASLALAPVMGVLGCLVLGVVIAARGGVLARGVGILGAPALAGWTVFVACCHDGPWLNGLASIGIGGAGSEMADLCLAYVLGAGAARDLFMLALLGGWAVGRDAPLRRLCALFSCAFFFLFWNPMLSETLASTVIGGPTYWRVLWALPAAALVGSFWSALVAWLPNSRRALSTLAVVAVGAAALLLLPRNTTVSPRNEVSFGAPGWRARRAEIDAAQALVAHAGPGVHVVAPLSVSPWIPTLHDHPFPLMVRTLYMVNLEGHLDLRDRRKRARLTNMMSGKEAVDMKVLRRAIEEYDLAAICLAEKAFDARLGEALRNASMDEVFRNDEYRVWKRR